MSSLSDRADVHVAAVSVVPQELIVEVGQQTDQAVRRVVGRRMSPQNGSAGRGCVEHLLIYVTVHRERRERFRQAGAFGRSFGLASEDLGCWIDPDVFL